MGMYIETGADVIAVRSDELDGHCPHIDSRIRFEVPGLTRYPVHQ